MGINIFPPDVNESRWDFTVMEAHERDTVEPGSTIGSIRFGLAAVKNVGLSAIQAIIEARETKEPFRSLADFCRKVDQRRVNRRVIEALIKCGAMDPTGARRAQMMEGLDMMMDQAMRRQKQEAVGQFGIFDSLEEEQDPPLPDVSEWKESQLLALERESVGFYISGHPLAAFEADIKRYATAATDTLDQIADGKEVIICGIIAGLKQKITKKNEKMAIINLEDLSGNVEVIVFPDLFRTAQHLFVTDAPFIIRGTLDKSEQGNKIKSLTINLLSEVKRRGATRMDIRLRSTGLSREDLLKLKEILQRFQGELSVYLRFQNPAGGDSVISAGRDVRVAASDSLVAEIEAFLGTGSVSFR
jgi:DNA polymerase-3 subunit alpha